MSEIRRDEIIYEEGWREEKPLSEERAAPSGEIPAEQTDAPPQKEKQDGSRPLLTVLQLVLCMAAALVLFLLKAMDSSAYHGFMSAYAEEMAKPVVSQKVFDAVDWNALFGGGKVTVTATPDELPDR